MGDFIELGLEGMDKLVDKHFHKVPDKYVDPETYKSKVRRGSKDSQDKPERRQRQRQRQREQHQDRNYEYRQRRSPSPPPSSSYSSYPAPPMAANNFNDRPRDNTYSTQYVQDGPYVAQPFSTMPPSHRPEYSPPPLGPRDPDRTSRYDTYTTYNNYTSSPTGGARPAPMRRRSSSYHGPRRTYEPFSSSDGDDEDDDYDGTRRSRRSQQLTHRSDRDRNASQSNLSTRSKDTHHHHNFKEEISNQFTTSKEGLAGGALGALFGGWATHKVLESKGRAGERGQNGGRHKDADRAWTLLGAAVGGLAINSIVDKFEDKKAANLANAREEKERDVLEEVGWSTGRGDDERSRGGGGRRDDYDYDDRDGDDRRHHHHHH